MNKQALPVIPNYHVGHLVAEGGTARVYWGVDLRSGFPVAIKELKQRFFANEFVRNNFRNVETQLYLMLEHRNIPRLVDFIDIVERNQWYIVMPFIEGDSLEHFIYNKMTLVPEHIALPIFVEILDTVAYIHQKGILHLDIKSNNVILTPKREVRLIDLGIASRMSDMGSSTTGYGTPSYMPPEQFEKKACGRYTDIFALGVMLFEMLTGRVPFIANSTDRNESIRELRRQIKEDPTPQMAQFYPFIGEELQRIVEKALQKEPRYRYQTCEEFLKDVKAYMKRHNIK
ncbi:MAG: serine/threonine-protein kinase [Alistipes sp.]|nr:serine/threonine protein kinase [Alistipes sp.]MDO5497980.1 serine/threonine-protein kinase [Alistipes sp.]